MQTTPLTLDGIFRRAETLWPSKRLLTATPRGIERSTYGAWADRTRRLGSVLDELGISPGGRVATFAWNTARHLELYFAAPCTGRVLHTLNIRLFAEQLIYIANHAEDEVIFCDRSLLPLLWPHIDQCKTVRYVVVMDDTGAGGAAELPGDPRILDYEALLAPARPHPFGGVTDENQAASMCYTSGTTGDPKGVLYSHRSVVLHSIAVCLADVLAVSEADVILPVVPMFHANAWGLCQAGRHDRIGSGVSRSGSVTGRDRRADPDRGRHPGGGCADDLDGGGRAAGGPPAPAAHDHLRRVRRAQGTVRTVPARGRPAGHPGVGDDRDESAGQHGPHSQ
jgi:fatty-acyl-CoA synthase